ncbi:MAG: BamA/TamA family outer membrane protein [Elusimicrobia bacterium]|nr:BamA/TamA family outer membrane protein [Elusimicrobiota bacterium]
MKKLIFLSLILGYSYCFTQEDKGQETPAVKVLKNNFLTKISDKLSFSAGPAQILSIPIFQNNKDLGSSYGVMSAIVFKSSDNVNPIKTVLAPSYEKSEKLGDSFSYRHYFFPGKGELAMARFSKSQGPKKEAVFWYYGESALGKDKSLDFFVSDSWDPKYSFYGYGPNSSEKDGENYVLDYKTLQLSLKFPIAGKVKIEYSPSYSQKKIKNGPFGSDEPFWQSYPNEYSQLSEQKKFFINKLSIFMDTTDHPFLPKIGNFLSFSAAFSAKPYSSYSYALYKAEAKKYYKLFSEDQVTALRYELQWISGNKNIPFYQMPVLGESSGLRAAGEGRYCSRAKFLATVEHRMTVSKSAFMKFLSELEFTPFLDMGTVAENPKDLKINKMIYGPGAAFRLVLRPHIAASANLAFYKEGYNFLINVGYPF